MTLMPTPRRSGRRRAAWASAALVAMAVLAPTGTASASSSPGGDDSSTPVATASPSPSAPGGCTPPKDTSPAPTATGPTTGGTPGTGTPGPLAWAPPKLTDPTTVRVTSSNRSLKLDQAKDYIIALPRTTVRLKGGLRVWGGHNVVLIGGEIDASGGRALYLHSQTGTVHVEGLHVTGNDVHEGINVAEYDRRATVQFENIKIDQVNGSYSTHHADLLQVWAGPSNLRVDGFEGSSTYQGFFFQPTQFNKQAPDLYDLRHVVLRDASRKSAYLLWQSARFPITTQDVTVVRNPKKPFPAQVMWPKNGKVWAGVTNGDASTPSPLTGDPGTSYVSPGYQVPGVQGAPPKA